MKQLLFLFLMFAILLVSCEKDSTGKGQLDPNAVILIKPATGVKAAVPGLSGLEVVEQALAIKWQSNWSGNTYWDDVKDIARGFSATQRDFDVPALKMFGTDIIGIDYNANGQYDYFYKDFIYGFNIVITDTNNDTIAYVPDAIINAARPLIEAAYEDGNYAEVYRLFDEAFTFIPITD